jgi:hypothetical protein
MRIATLTPFPRNAFTLWLHPFTRLIFMMQAACLSTVPTVSEGIAGFTQCSHALPTVPCH